MQGLFLYCRTGFEGECAAEIQEKAGLQGIHGFVKAKPDSGYIIFGTHSAADAEFLTRHLTLGELVFCRQWFILLQLCKELLVTDRVSGLLEALQALPAPAGEVILETPDTNEGKTLSALCRSLEKPLTNALRKAKLLGNGPVVHICFLSTNAAYVGYIPAANSSPWPMGIPRLKFPAAAPSRSTLKLEEAFLQFLSPEERDRRLQPGMRAVDLGACPGGWTWQLVRRGIKVTAIDNGPMADAVMASGLVEHLREDGFRYRPALAVDWLVCDMVEQPIRIADLMATWLENRCCNATIFNLKLPMKKRYQELKRCLALIDERLATAGISYSAAAKQLYHDREEVTVYIRLE